MPRHAARGRGPRAVGIAAVVTAALLAGSLVQPITHAQPAPDVSRARDLYRSAEAAMKDGRFDDAIRDYGAAYELSKDPALFFKIGRANERAGRCETALIYYARYLREGKPTEQFTATTRERILACGGDARSVEGSAAPVSPEPTSETDASGTPGTTAQAGSAAGTTEPAGATEPAGEAGSAAGSATEPVDGAAASAGSGAPRVLIPSNHHKVAWLLTGGAIALAALGGILGYAADSSENDVRDLYVGFAGQPATFDGQTRKRYDDLVDQGHRYEHLSWASFGLAGAAAVGAAVLFVIGGREEAAPAVTPVVTRTGAGVAVRF